MRNLRNKTFCVYGIKYVIYYIYVYILELVKS